MTPPQTMHYFGGKSFKITIHLHCQNYHAFALFDPPKPPLADLQKPEGTATKIAWYTSEMYDQKRWNVAGNTK